MKLTDWINRQPARISFERSRGAAVGPAIPQQAFAARTEIVATTIGDPELTHLSTAGYGVPGDGGGAIYARVATEPPHPGKVRSADGTWWEMVPETAGINVKALGAIEGADSTDALRDALTVAIALQSAHRYDSGNASGTYTGSWDKGCPSVILPAGTFQIDLTAGHLWDLTGQSASRGLRIRGAGSDQTFLRLTGGDAKHILHNTNRAKNILLAGFSVHDETGNDSNLLCYVNSTGTAKNVTIEDVHTEHMAVYKVEGTGNGDHFRAVHVVAEDIPNGQVGYHFNNPQSVDNGFIGCEWIGLAGKGIFVEAGGAIWVMGGSAVIYKGGRFLDVDRSGALIGSGNGTYDIYSLKTELRSNGTGADPQVLYLNAPATVNFYGSTYSVDQVSGSRTIDPYVVDRGLFQVHNAAYWQGNQKITINAANSDASSRHPPMFVISGSTLGAQLADIVTINAPPGGGSNYTSYGQAIADGCWGDGGQNPVDVHINHENAGHDRPVRLKRAIFRNGNSINGGLPANGSPLSFTLPPGATVHRVGIRKHGASGSAGAVYDISDGMGAPVTLWTSPPIGNGDDVTKQSGVLDPEHQVTAANNVFTCANTTASAATARGYVFVEWF